MKNEQTLEQVQGCNPLLEQDLKNSIQHNNRAIAEQAEWNIAELDTGKSLQEQLNTAQQWAGRFAGALKAWPDIRAAATEVNG